MATRLTAQEADTLAEIEREMARLMATLGRQHVGRSLTEMGWRFGFDRARRRLGACHWKRGHRIVRRITLSKPFALVRGWEGMADTARHEIAHALDYETRGRSDHGPAWQAWARRCGADPTRLDHGPMLDAKEAPYVGVCGQCGERYPFYRQLKRARACAACCERHGHGRFDPRFVLRLERNERGG